MYHECIHVFVVVFCVYVCMCVWQMKRLQINETSLYNVRR